MQKLRLIFLWIVFILSIGACDQDKIDVDTTSIAENLPLLNKVNAVGTIIGFNSYHSIATEDSINARWNDAVQAGMSIARLQIDWPDLEPFENTYAKDLLRQELEKLSNQKLQVFLTITAYDSDGPVIPAYLDHLAIDHQMLIQRFNRLMDWVIPLLVEHNGWVISIANEPDNDFPDHPEVAEKILTFLIAVKSHIHQIEPKMAVTVTMAEGGLDAGLAGMKEIVNASDVASFNFYGSNSDKADAPQTAEKIRTEIRDMLNFTGEKRVIFQELGMHSDSQLLNSSEEIQRMFFTTVFQEMQKEPRLRAAMVFQMVDWSEETISILNQDFGQEVPQWFIDQFSASLASIGLIYFENGQRKKAWNEFIKWVKQFN